MLNRFIIQSALLFFSVTIAFSQSNTEKVNWVSFEKAMELNKTAPKKIMIKVHTSWCGWCKRMDDSTFSNAVIAKYINSHFYAVKMDAERKDTLYFKDKMYINPNPAAPRCKHQLASELLKGRLYFPSVVFLDEKLNTITISQGYLKPAEMEPLLKWVGDNNYLNSVYEEFQKTFKGEVK